jgi:hypothetical protein
MHYSATRGLRLVPVAVALAVAVSACGGSSSSSSLGVTSPSATAVTDTFSGTIAQNGTAIHAFTVKTAGYTLLAGYTSLAPATVTALGMGIGAWDGSTSTCGLNLSQNDAARSGSTAISGTASAGNYCIRVYDGGNVPAGETVTYTLQVQHY